MTRGAHFFLSASGKNSEIGNSHPLRDANIRKRFDRIRSDTAEKHDILEPICVYTPRELEELMWGAGFITVDLWESGFGNVKGVFSKEVSS